MLYLPWENLINSLSNYVLKLKKNSMYTVMPLANNKGCTFFQSLNFIAVLSFVFYSIAKISKQC